MNDLFLGVDIGGTKTGVALGNGQGRILAKTQFPTIGTPSVIIQQIVSAGQVLIAKCQTQHIESIGISCGGPLDTTRGEILSPPHLPRWNHIPITRVLEQELGVPAFLQNDANACALAEWNWGNGRGTKNMIFLTFGTGFGAGLILNGKLYEGTNGMAGEIGHVRIAPSGPSCYGKCGSIESFCSGEGISLLYEQEYGKKLSAKDICLRANSDDAPSRHVISISARYLGYALSMLIDILNPEKIIIGSIYTRDKALFTPIIQEIIAQEALPQCSSVCDVVPSSLGNDIGYMAALGVAKSFCEEEEGGIHDRIS